MLLLQFLRKLRIKNPEIKSVDRKYTRQRRRQKVIQADEIKKSEPARIYASSKFIFSVVRISERHIVKRSQRLLSMFSLFINYLFGRVKNEKAQRLGYALGLGVYFTLCLLKNYFFETLPYFPLYCNGQGNAFILKVDNIGLSGLLISKSPVYPKFTNTLLPCFRSFMNLKIESSLGGMLSAKVILL